MSVALAVFLAGLVNWIATVIITQGKIFEPVRNYIGGKGEYLRYLVQCYLCAGVWVGIIEAAFFGLTHAPQPWHAWVLILANALTYKAIGHFLYIGQELLDAICAKIRRS